MLSEAQEEIKALEAVVGKVVLPNRRNFTPLSQQRPRTTMIKAWFNCTWFMKLGPTSLLSSHHVQARHW